MVNIELRLLAAMLKSGNFRPIQTGEITAEHFVTDEGRIAFNFIKGYKYETDGAASWPSLAIFRNRMADSAIEIPDPDPGDDIRALTYETLLQKTRADIQGIGEQLIEIARSSPQPLEQIAPLVGKLRSSTDRLHRTRNASFSEGIEEVLLRYDEGGILRQGMPWPWRSMNNASRGLHRKELIVIAGRPKSRKTFVALSIAAHLVREAKLRVLFVSPEMPAHQVLLRFIAFFCKLRYTEFKNSALDKAEEMRLFEAAYKFAKIEGERDEQYSFRLRSVVPDLPPGATPDFNVVQSTGRPVSWIESQIELYSPDLIICDSFYRQAPEGKKRDDGWKDMTSISRTLKDLAMEKNCCIIGTHQMNRGAETSIGGLANLALADAVGQDADLIMRVITGKIEGQDRSALVILGGREIPFDGIMINNKPCYDYDEIEKIDSRKQVEKLMKMEDEEEEAETAKKEEGNKKASAAVSTIRNVGKNQHKKKEAQATKNPVDENMAQAAE